MSNQKGFSKVAIIIIVLILIGGAYFVFSKKDKNIPAQNTEDQSSQSSQSIGGELSVSEWKTYRNDQYGFEFKYPLFYKEPDVFTRHYPYLLGANLIKNEQPKDFNIRIIFGVFEANYFDNYTSMEVEEHNSLTLWNIGKDFKFGENVTRKILDKNKFNQEHLYYVFKKGKYAVAFEFGGLPMNTSAEKYVSDNVPELNQILSTFKFTK